MSNRYQVLIVSLLLATHPIYAAQSLPVGDGRGGFSIVGFKRTYLLHVPVTYNGQTALPLVIVLHGTSGQGVDAERITGFNTIADHEGFMVVYPDSLVLDRTFRWVIRDSEGHYDVAFIEALIDRLQKTLNIDSRRIYVTGMSNGGYFTYVLACTLPGKFAAIATVIGGMERSAARHCQSIDPLPMLMINGTADQDVPMIGNTLTLPTSEIRDFWRKADGCTTDSVNTALPDVEPQDGTTTLKSAWTDCQANSEVVQYVIQGGEHAWPGYTSPWIITVCEQLKRCPPLDFSASEEIWAFFSHHQL